MKPTTLCEEVIDGMPREYVHGGEYYPQQFRWVDNKYIDDVLRGNHKIFPMRMEKPAGVWLSGNMGWAEWCRSEGMVDKFLVNYSSLKAFVSPRIKVCEIGSREDFERLGGGKIEDVWVLIPMSNEERRQIREAYGEFFQGIKENYGGIHLSHEGEMQLSNIFEGWVMDSTVIFNPRDLRYEMVTREELGQLGWDKYDWIITKEAHQWREDIAGLYNGNTNRA